MNKAIIVLTAVLISAALSGCGAAAKTIMSKSQSERTDVFKEASLSDSASPGYANVLIKANIKTHLEGYYIGESRDSAHGKPTYPILLNIDGQAIVWHVPGVRDKKPAYDGNGRTSLDPEARDGMKYVLEKKIQVPAGKHVVFFGLSEEPYHMTTEIAVRDGESYVLEFKPVYRYKTIPTRIPTFLQGIKNYDVVLNEISR